MIVAVVKVISNKKTSKSSFELNNQYDFQGLVDESQAEEFIIQRQAEGGSVAINGSVTYEIWKRV